LIAWLAPFLAACPGVEAGSDPACERDCSAPSCSCDGRRAGESCVTDADCVAGTICEDSTCVGTGPLRITLHFQIDSDFDLHVLTPYGNEICFATDAADGGVLDVDQCVTPCGVGNHIENVVFSDKANPGRYRVWVVNYNGRGAGDFDIEVVRDGASLRFTGSLPAERNSESRHFPFTVERQEG
jgi:hypothetical protein